eukprot:5791893-Amphidinium_carterae.1
MSAARKAFAVIIQIRGALPAGDGDRWRGLARASLGPQTDSVVQSTMTACWHSLRCSNMTLPKTRPIQLGLARLNSSRPDAYGPCWPRLETLLRWTQRKLLNSQPQAMFGCIEVLWRSTWKIEATGVLCTQTASCKH